jgi:hypothetical protein
VGGTGRSSAEEMGARREEARNFNIEFARLASSNTQFAHFKKKTLSSQALRLRIIWIREISSLFLILKFSFYFYFTIHMNKPFCP